MRKSTYEIKPNKIFKNFSIILLCLKQKPVKIKQYIFTTTSNIKQGKFVIFATFLNSSSHENNHRGKSSVLNASQLFNEHFF